VKKDFGCYIFQINWFSKWESDFENYSINADNLYSKKKF
jgi:hypothetical protein